MAAIDFLPSVNFYVMRDNMNIVYNANTNEQIEISKLNKMKIAVICNGWFMHPHNNNYIFPPPHFIIPLFVSIHLTSLDNNIMYNDDNIKYFKNYEPIGCRDKFTYDNLTSRGINCYFSGCLTLNLKNKFTERNDLIYYSTNFKPEIKDTNTKYIYHGGQFNKNSIKERLNIAQHHYLEKYMTAKKVYTDRLHCYMPCLAFGTDVTFLSPYANSEIRFVGLINEKKEILIDRLNEAKKHINDFIIKFKIKSP